MRRRVLPFMGTNCALPRPMAVVEACYPRRIASATPHSPRQRCRADVPLRVVQKFFCGLPVDLLKLY